MSQFEADKQFLQQNDLRAVPISSGLRSLAILAHLFVTGRPWADPV